MKMFKFLVFVLASIAVFTISIIAQTEKRSDVASSKIASVNPKAFEDEKTGIKDLINANAQLDAEFKPQIDELKALNFKLQKLQTEIEDYQKILNKRNEVPIANYKPITAEATAKFEECQKLSSEFKNKQSSYKLFVDKRESEIITPIKIKIGDALKQFAKEKGYAFILDIKSLACDCVDEDPTPDITIEFIKFYNDLSEKEKAR